jgi:hypothetical protein
LNGDQILTIVLLLRLPRPVMAVPLITLFWPVR